MPRARNIAEGFKVGRDPRAHVEHPAYALMLAESERTGLPRAFKTDLTEHDRAWLNQRDPKLSFLWSLRSDGTHVVGLEPLSSERENTAPKIFESLVRGFEGIRFYIWNGVTLQSYASTEAARAGMLDLIEREAEHARDLAARFCASDPKTPHVWQGTKCGFCDFPKPREESTS